jgi:uncharacterized protein (TIGR02246 family)
VHSENTTSSHDAPRDEQPVRALHQAILSAWNRRSAADLAALFTADGSLVGFDGTQNNGRAEIAAALADIFANHPTPAFVGIVRGVRFPAPRVALLRAVAGMVPDGKSDVNPALNAVQTLVATERDGRWLAEMFHNTPAAFHGRPEAGDQLTQELRAALAAARP